MRDRRYDALDGLRGAAAIAVIIFHFASVSNPSLIPNGGLAVDFFYVMSGFVVGFAYETRLLNGFGFRGFMKARLIRLYPLIFVGAIIGTVGYLKAYKFDILFVDLIAALSLLPTPFSNASEGHNALPANPPEWSLVFEVFGNAIYAFSVRRLSNFVLLISILIFLILYEASYLFFQSDSFGYSWPTFIGGIPRFAVSFLIGIALFRVKDHKLCKRLTIPFLPLLFLLLLCFCTDVREEYRNLHHFVCIVVVFPLIVLSASLIEAKKPQRTYIFLGEISYPAYILQGGFVPHVKALPAHLGLDGAQAVLFIVAATIMYILFAWLVFLHFDVPIRNFLLKDRRVDGSHLKEVVKGFATKLSLSCKSSSERLFSPISRL